MSFAAVDFGEKVIIFSPDDPVDSITNAIDRVNARLFGKEMDSDRYAILFKPGDYREAGLINIPFYVHVAGLGATPYDVKVSNIHTPPHLRDGNGTCTFWRSLENLSVIGPETYNEPETFKWAVSQAAPLRRVYSTRTMRNQWENGWVSGGFTADCRFEAPAGSDHQQQWYTRNSILRKGRGD
ncbi:MAG: glycoside hydrolase family 16, partial [Muribaculaceae bacterium]|nr:glycoside hydrolase family 16 [Muribaculaceae bacterium]